MKNGQIVGLLVVVALIIGAIVYLEHDKAGPGIVVHPAVDVTSPEAVAPEASSTNAIENMATKDTQIKDTQARIAEKASLYEKAKEISAPSGFVNTDGKPITISQYVGKKVILLDIMTYSCINCIRTFPYLVDWYKKYEDKGLIIIAIHTPEFDFEKNIDNVRAAMQKYGITFPVVLDNDYGTWTAYHNQYWPRKYLIDIDGFIRYDHIGEGGYDETEAKIQDLLKERAQVLGLDGSVKVDMPVTEGPTGAPVSPGQSEETYFGSNRANSAMGWKLSGNWKSYPEYIQNEDAAAAITYPVAAKKIFLVASADKPVKVDISIDGKQTNTVTVEQAELYNIFSSDTFGAHTLEIKPETTGLRVFTLTFGN